MRRVCITGPAAGRVVRDRHRLAATAVAENCDARLEDMRAKLHVGLAVAQSQFAQASQTPDPPYGAHATTFGSHRASEDLIPVVIREGRYETQ